MKFRNIIIVATFLSVALVSDAATWFVKVDGGSDTAGTTWPGSWNFATFVSKLEEGVIADGDVVCFAGGLYRTDDIVAVRIKNRRLTLRGGYPPDLRISQTPELTYPTDTPTIITGDSNGSGQPDDYDVRNIFYIDGSDSPSTERNINIEGFTLSGCYYEGTNAYECGAVCVELAQGVTLRNCVIEGNRARHGGGAGLTVSGSTVHVADCIFTGNKAADAGAAIRASRRTAGSEAYDPILVVERSLINGNVLTANDAYPDGDAPEVLYNGIVLPSTWPPKNLSPQSREPMPVPYLEEENIPAVIPINVGRQLFVDDFLIGGMEGIERRWYQARKYSGNPILKPETELEIYSAGNPCAAPKDGGVYWDENDGIFKMWYEAGWLNAQAYATSRDGLSWERPTLGIGRGNQIIPGYAPNSCGVIVDYDAPANERYKIYFRPPNDKAEKNIYGYTAISADGIHWNNLALSGSSGDRSTMFYNPFRKKYVFSLRNGGGLGPSPNGRNRWYRECSNFLAGSTWTGRNVVYWCGADNLDEPDPAIGINPELYNVNAVAYESVMLGMLQIFLGPQNDQCKEQGIPKRTDLKVAFSRDGFHWQRPSDRTSFIPSSGGSAWDKGYVQSVGGICSVVGDQLRFYYICFRGDETRPGTGYGMHAHGSTGIAVLRRDGFCSLSADAGGTVTTRPVIFDGSYLFVNVDSSEGSLKAELLDEDGNVVDGFSADECEPVSEDSTISLVTWKNNDSLAAFAGKPVRLRFILDKAHLYSFWVSTSQAGESRGYVAGGGPGYKTNLDVEGISAYEKASGYTNLE